MNFEEIKEEIKAIKNWKCLEIIRDLCIERLDKEFDILVPFGRFILEAEE